MANFRDQLVEHLRLIGPVIFQPLMGGFGLHLEEAHFAILHGDRLYLLTDEATRTEHRRQGMTAFDPNPRQPYGAFFEVPADVLDDLDSLLAWSRRAAATARSGPAPIQRNGL